METNIYIPNREDIQRWVKEAVLEYIQLVGGDQGSPITEPLISRKEAAHKLEISLVTLNDWKKRGLPSYKNRGRVYFLWSEIIKFLTEKQPIG